MAAPGTNGEYAVDEFKPPPGVVLPPREIRNILEKTAGYVARNGAVFEDRIREKERQNPKFSFLSPADAYNPFYLWRLSEIRDGRGSALAAGRSSENATPAPEKPAGPPKPPDFEFSARMPRINQKDLDVLRLTALFVAKNGRQFMTQLGQRETSNPQFQFLIPNHTFHNFFQHLVDQYTKLIRASGLSGEGGKLQDERVAELERMVDDKYLILERAQARAEYIKFQEKEKREQQEAEEEKAAEYARIDWGDFVVVETITFTDADETANLPPPTNLAELQYASLEDRNKASISASMRIEEAMPGDEVIGNGHSYPLPVHTGYAPQAQTDNHAQQQAHSTPPPLQERNGAQERYEPQQPSADPHGGPPAIRIKENYVPRASQKGANRNVQMALCPNCKQQIPMEELDAHMRIELLDPRWKEQKNKAEIRHASSNISHADVANNLKRLASQRSDVFDPITGQAITEDELARRKKAAIQSYDGHTATKVQAQQAQSINVEEQIRAIHQKFQDKKT